MEKKICTLDICGLDVDLILTDDDEVFRFEAETTNGDFSVWQRLKGIWLGYEVDEYGSFGKYSVDDCKIWLDCRLSPSVLCSHLFHEVYEFVLGYFNVKFNPKNEHSSYMIFSNILWAVFKANQDILFGTKLVELIRKESFNESRIT